MSFGIPWFGEVGEVAVGCTYVPLVIVVASRYYWQFLTKKCGVEVMFVLPATGILVKNG